MRAICEDIKAHVHEVMAEWERLAACSPWATLSPADRAGGLPEVVVGLVEAALCSATDVEAHRMKVRAAAEHGECRRRHGVAEAVMFEEYHLLRRALWSYLTRKFGAGDRSVQAIGRIDTAITLATEASLWGYNRPEIEALGKWEAGLERLGASSPLLRRAGWG
ncbi:MAG TPA: hypothetical protein VHG51_16040 [Longimicrobiaceae bacterium]|nr:hypothetical protein [Longimicrobiaceae bacterium]